MLVGLLKESSKEQRIFRGEVVEKVEVFDGICRILLKDEVGDYVYCLVQGMQWFDKIKEIKIGQRILLCPSKVVKVLRRHKSFYTPDIKGQNVSPLYFHYNTHDIDLGISIDNSINKNIQGFYKLNEIFSWLQEKNSVRCGIIGVIIDFYMKNTDDSTALENYYRIKIVDDTIDTKLCININFYMKKVYLLKKISVGDIIVAQNVNFYKKKSYFNGVHNRSSGSLGIFSWLDGRLEFSQEDFILSQSIMQSVIKLQNWIFNELQYSKVFPSGTLSLGLGSNSPVEVVLYLFQIFHDFPEPGLCTLLFCGQLNFGYLSVSPNLISHVRPNQWVKLSQVKLLGNKIELGEFSSIVSMPDWTSLIKTLVKPSAQEIKQALYEFNKISGLNSFRSIRTKHSQQSFMALADLLDFNDSTVFTRIKALVIEFNPTLVGLGVVRAKNNRLSYSCILKVWVNPQVLTVVVCGKDSDLFYGLCEYDQYSSVVSKVTKAQEALLKSQEWVELGIKRLVKGHKVLLVLSETEIKSYD
jgi:hypothetical protein